jgi:hypothetical protein
MLYIPKTERELIPFALDLIEACRVSAGRRSAYCRLLNAITETGKPDGTKSLLNWLYWQLTSKAEHIFSPVELKFTLDFDREYSKDTYEKAAVVSKQITRHWDRTNTDFLFGEGVFESLKYGSCFLKQWVQIEGENATPHYLSGLVMPWQMGFYNEAENELARQPAICETTSIPLVEVWRRLSHLPNAKKLFERVRGHASKGTAMSEPQSYFHQILSTSTIQTGVNQATRPLPGGIVQLNNDPNYAIMGPTIGVDVVQVHELWVQGFDDYVTIQMVEPDVIISPLIIGGQVAKLSNTLGITGEQPYTLIQTNPVTNYIWGRSELVDLLEPQALIAMWLEDARRLMGVQVDKFLAFIGEGGPTDETYGAMRMAGYVNMQQGAQVQDLTPKWPDQLIPAMEFMLKHMMQIGGFPKIMRGEGEEGVRAGIHADTLMKTASPQLRGAALRAERQCAQAADLTLQMKEAKDDTRFWTKADTIDDVEKTSFRLTDLPSDWRVTVDSHSSSPIFADENAQLIMASHKMGIVDGEYVLDNMPFSDKDAAKGKLREREKQKQAMMQQLLQKDPQALEKLLSKGGGKR